MIDPPISCEVAFPSGKSKGRCTFQGPGKEQKNKEGLNVPASPVPVPVSRWWSLGFFVINPLYLDTSDNNIGREERGRG